jgi:hypothetical protein
MRRVAIIVAGSAAIAGCLLLISWRQKAGNLAAKFIDIKEIGDNADFSNAVFKKMLQDIGWKGGEAWCMYFDKSIYMQAFPNKANEINRVLTGSTQQSWKNAIANPQLFKVITSGDPRIGDIIIWQSINNDSLGHAGIALKKQKGKTWFTVEGNSGLGGTREGQGVVKLSRYLVPGTVTGNLKLLGFIRLKTNIF